MDRAMPGETMMVRVRKQFKYDGVIRRRREVLDVPAPVAEYLFQTKKVKPVVKGLIPMDALQVPRFIAFDHGAVAVCEN